MFSLEVMKEHLILQYLYKDWGFHKILCLKRSRVQKSSAIHSLCNLDAVYAIFSLEKVWQSHDFMHIFTQWPQMWTSFHNKGHG